MLKCLGLLTIGLLLAACTSGATPKPIVASTPKATTPPAASRPSPNPSPSPSPQLLYLRETSLNTLWALRAGRIEYSTDQGRTWTVRSPAWPWGSESLFALSDEVAWAIGSGEMARTTDAGMTWNIGPSPGGSLGPHFADFVDSARGWMLVGLGAAAGSEGVAVYRSVDAGTSWTKVADSGDPSRELSGASGLAFGCDKSGITFLNGSV